VFSERICTSFGCAPRRIVKSAKLKFVRFVGRKRRPSVEEGRRLKGIPRWPDQEFLSQP
jgi:hypothetical protein